MHLLTKDEVKKQLKTLENWKYQHQSIKRKYVFNTYMESIQYINLLAEKAEENNHHPDLVVGWCKISLVFTSHDIGGVTQLCIKMAKEAEKIFSSIDSS
ncbi:MAG: 4a-hydroxytetrahydrobiopterin dehydratase [Candidatus Neomarinimicrobiota bacterium]